MVKVFLKNRDEVLDMEYKYAVICAKYKDKWIFCRHKQRNTWEIPGGHREINEAIEETAKRELIEETGAIEFEITSISAYCVDKDCEKTYGALFFANVTELGDIPFDSEIKEIALFDNIPEELTYPKIQPYLFERVNDATKPCYSYVMGIDESVLSLTKYGFDVKRDGDNYTVTFSKCKAPIWEDFISEHLQLEYWNEYFVDGKIVFLFHLQDGINRYEVENYDDDQVLKLCEKLCGCKFESIKSMLLGNWFYNENIGEK